MSNDKALLLSEANTIEIDLAKSLLSEAGIPCVVEGPDFDVAQLGRGAHDMIRGQNLFVLADRYDEAKALLDEAWEDGQRALVEMGTPPPVEAPEAEAETFAARGFPIVTVFFAGLTVLFGYMWLHSSSELYFAQTGDPNIQYDFQEGLTLGYWKGTGNLALETRYDESGTSGKRIYDKQGIPASHHADGNRDGVYEQTTVFDRSGNMIRQFFDNDGDDRPELMIEHRRDGTTIEYMDEDKDGFYEMRNLLTADGVKRTEVETRPGHWAPKNG